MAWYSITLFIVYLIFGIFLLNVPLGIIPMPDFIQAIENWIIFIGGVLIIIGGINHFRARRASHRARMVAAVSGMPVR